MTQRISREAFLVSLTAFSLGCTIRPQETPIKNLSSESIEGKPQVVIARDTIFINVSGINLDILESELNFLTRDPGIDIHANDNFVYICLIETATIISPQESGKKYTSVISDAISQNMRKYNKDPQYRLLLLSTAVLQEQIKNPTFGKGGENVWSADLGLYLSYAWAKSYKTVQAERRGIAEQQLLTDAEKDLIAKHQPVRIKSNY